MLACSAGLLYFSFPHEREITAKQANEEGSGWVANGRACEFANAIRAIYDLRFPRQRAAGRSHCAGAREPERKERAAGARSLAMLDRRRSRVAALRRENVSGQALRVNAHQRHVLSVRSEEHTSELQSHLNIVCRLLLEKKKV